MAPRESFRFGPFTLDPSRRVLAQDGQPVAINARAFDLLLALIEKPGEVVKKDDLMNRLWPDSHVEEANLAVAASALRKALGDTPTARLYIATIPARGYVFTADLTRAESPLVAPVPIAVPDSDPKPEWRGTMLRAMVIILTVVAVGAIWLAFTRRGESEAKFRIVPFVNDPSGETFPAFSPDGTRMAYSSDAGPKGYFGLYVKSIGAEKPVQLTASDSRDDTVPVWSPDGSQIAFLRCCEQDSGVFVIPSAGGPVRKIAEASRDQASNRGVSLDWSPDGKSLAISYRTGITDPLSIYSVTIATGERRKLTSPRHATLGDLHPHYSPDGRQVAFLRAISLDDADIYVMPSAGGEPRRVTADSISQAGLAWTENSQEIVFSSVRESGFALWRIAVSGGQPRRVNVNGEETFYPAIARRGNRLAYTKTVFSSHLWRIDLGQTGPPVKLAASALRELGPQYSPQGDRLAFVSTRTGGAEIWVSDQDGQNPRRLTSFDGPPARTPRWSPDGSRIAFEARPGGNCDIYIVNSAGGTPRRFTAEASADEAPSWSRDGRWIYFSSNRSGSWQIWKQPVDGGPAVQVTTHRGYGGFESVDGRLFYYAKSRTERGLWSVPVSGGDETLVMNNLEASDWAYFAVSEKGIYYLERAEVAGTFRASIRLFDPVTKTNTLLALLQQWPAHEDPGFPGTGLTVSPGGRSIIYTFRDPAEERGADIQLVENFR